MVQRAPQEFLWPPIGTARDNRPPFEKSGRYDEDGPMAAFWQAWFADPELRLPRGRYEITAYLHHGPRRPRCIGPSQTLTASVAIEVVADPGPPESSPPTPLPSTTPAGAPRG